MNYDYIVVRYGEITLKTRNRNMFIRILKKNMMNALHDYPVEIDLTYSSGLITMNGAPHDEVIEKLRFISGILSVSPVVKIDRDIHAVKRTASHMAGKFKGQF